VTDEQSDPAPPFGVDLDRPSVARLYDYFLGGSANWAIDRDFGERVLTRLPLIRDMAIANRLFLNRVVRHLTRLGVRQFLDIGAGVPTAGNTHQVADQLAVAAGRTPDTRVVYADNEPVAVAHAELLLDSDGDPNRHAAIDADLRDPDDLWRKALDTELLEPDEPIALLLIAVLHFHQAGPDGNDIGAECVARFRELLPAGSFLAVSHTTIDGVPVEIQDKLAELGMMYEASSNKGMGRTRAEIASLLGDFRLVEPGWRWTPEWHPEETGPGARSVAFPAPNHAAVWCGVGEKASPT
jgi:hypothetical protein